MTKPKILVLDDLPPEDVAMLQALYSRSSESVIEHLKRLKNTGSRSFMSRHYVGFGHKSIADGGTTTVFFEGVSLLAAKAIQDWPLYSGQETSTRYIDMANQPIVDPVGSAESKAVLDTWMQFYTSNQERVAETIRQRHPKRDTENDTKSIETYDRAVKARTFDILRGFLPAGITTQLSWHTNLRQAADHLQWLVEHPAHEIRQAAIDAREALSQVYPSSGFDKHLAGVSGVADVTDERRAWVVAVSRDHTYALASALCEDVTAWSTIEPVRLIPYLPMIMSRPRGCVLPHFLTDLGQIHFQFPLDFGSFRDIQRHRNGVCRMPLLTTGLGFEPWYLNQLDLELKNEALGLIVDQAHRIRHLTEDPVIRQYYTALGFRVQTQVTYGLPAAVYVMELRAGKHIHGSLRKKTHGCVQRFREMLPDVPLHVDLDPDDWDVRRGNQTITIKEEGH